MDIKQTLTDTAKSAKFEGFTVDFDVRESRLQVNAHLRGSIDLPGDADQVLANMTDLQQVLINLLLNGADASQPGSRLTLFARQDGSAIEIGVSDQGSGIATEHQAHLFDPFFTTKDAGLGTGLGLSVCRQLVDRHQGKLTFHTELGKGTTFTVRLPARQPGSEIPSF